MITDTASISIHKTSASRLQDVDLDNVVFGRVFSDHMFVMDYVGGKWQAPVIEPFKDLSKPCIFGPTLWAIHF